MCKNVPVGGVSGSAASALAQAADAVPQLSPAAACSLALQIPLVTCRAASAAFRWDNRPHGAAFLLPATQFLLSTERGERNTFLPLFPSLSCCKLLCVGYRVVKESKLCLGFCLLN